MFADSQCWHLWSWILLSANHRERHARVLTGRGYTTVTLGPGQMLFGRKSAAETLHMNESTVRRRLKKLTDLECISVKAAGHFSIVTVLKWDEYQHPEEPERPGKGQAKAGQRPGKGRAKATLKNGKHSENGEKVLIDHSFLSLKDWGPDFAENVLRFAGRYFVGPLTPKTEAEARFVLRASALGVLGKVPERGFVNGSQAITQRQGPPPTAPLGFFRDVFRKTIAESVPDFEAIMKTIPIPSGLTGRILGHSAKNGDIAPCER